ncbi:MAG: tetratricopeptide repeat protein [Candidatus Hodarchaeota archaeon]
MIINQQKPEELIRAKQLIHQGELEKAWEIVLEFEKRDNLTELEIHTCKLLKANLLYRDARYKDAIDFADQLIKESQERGDLLSSFDGLMIQGFYHAMVGDINKTENILNQADVLFQKMKEELHIELNERESFMIRIKANVYTWKGEVHRSLEYNQRALKLAEGSDDKELTSACLINIAENYQLLRDYNKAKIFAERAIMNGYPPYLVYYLGVLIDILIKLNDIENAKLCLQQISEYKMKDESKINDIIYLYYKALLLKSSLRAKNRAESEKLFKEVIDEIEISRNIQLFLGEKRILALINLCDLLLIELRITNDLNILDEINPYLRKLLEFSEQQRAYWVLAETHLLQAKLSLLTFDINKAKRFLTQAQQIAERFGLTQMSTKIASESTNLQERLSLWEKLKDSKATIAERFDLAQLEEQINGMVQNRALLSTIVFETEVAIHKEKKICLVCRGEVLRFSYICECGTIYCDNCARAVTDLENVCWVCEAPLDYLKPVKPIKEVEKAKIVKNSKKE